jgi:hypothetical protein
MSCHQDSHSPDIDFDSAAADAVAILPSINRTTADASMRRSAARFIAAARTRAAAPRAAAAARGLAEPRYGWATDAHHVVATAMRPNDIETSAEERVPPLLLLTCLQVLGRPSTHRLLGLPA